MPLSGAKDSRAWAVEHIGANADAGSWNAAGESFVAGLAVQPAADQPEPSPEPEERSVPKIVCMADVTPKDIGRPSDKATVLVRPGAVSFVAAIPTPP